MKYRKIGLRMCIISIIMIVLCIPNQIQIANAAEGSNSEEDLKVYSKENGKWTEWKNGTNLNLFPNRTETEGKKYDIKPDDHGDYSFRIENNLGYKATCKINIEASINEESEDKTYPITYQLYRREENKDISLLGSEEEWENPFDYKANTIIRTEKIANGEEKEYVLSWKFEEANLDYNGGNYQLSLTVEARPTDSDDNTTPVNPDDDKKDDNKGNNNNSTDNGNSGNNSSNNNESHNGNNTSNTNKGNNTNNNNQNNKDNLNIDKTSSKGTGSTETNKKKVNTSDITTPVIYVALMILMFGLILLVKSRKEN